jgi:hypothetical protein
MHLDKTIHEREDILDKSILASIRSFAARYRLGNSTVGKTKAVPFLIQKKRYPLPKKPHVPTKHRVAVPQKNHVPTKHHITLPKKNHVPSKPLITHDERLHRLKDSIERLKRERLKRTPARHDLAPTTMKVPSSNIQHKLAAFALKMERKSKIN